VDRRISFLAPFLGAWLWHTMCFGWSWPAAQICGVALSTTSLAVVYAVLVGNRSDPHDTGEDHHGLHLCDRLRYRPWP